MSLIDQSPFEWLEFDENGALTDAAAKGRLEADIATAGATDLVVISHGWKTDQVGAGQLYTPLWQNVTQALTQAGDPAPQKIVVGGVLWPSKQFEDDFDTAAAQKQSGGTLAVPPTLTDDFDLAPASLAKVVAGFCELIDPDKWAALKAAVEQNSGGYTDASAKQLLDVVKDSAGLAGNESDKELEADVQGLFDTPLAILDSLALLVTARLNPTVGQTLDLGDTLSNVIQGPRAAIARLLNQVTYFTMKKRAGTVGAQLGSDVLSHLAVPHPVRLHLIGHSFGARLVTAAAANFQAPAQLSLESLTFLQGAYSHNGLSAQMNGAFASVLASAVVKGPISMTHTHNDSACTIAYPLASRLSRDTTQSLGDATDAFGAMGANGAQNLDASILLDQAMAPAQKSYALTPGKVNRVLADRCVSEHMDVTNTNVGALVASALRA